jgi:hypothetical protein
MTKTPKRPRDPNQLAKFVIDLATGDASETETQKDPVAVARGRLGGSKGGSARAASLTSEERQESARKAIRARWSKA